MISKGYVLYALEWPWQSLSLTSSILAVCAASTIWKIVQRLRRRSITYLRGPLPGPWLVGKFIALNEGCEKPVNLYQAISLNSWLLMKQQSLILSGQTNLELRSESMGLWAFVIISVVFLAILKQFSLA